jgi:5'-methylthioadenosine phosphorylase
MYADVGLIGGTGVGERLAALGGTALHVPTSEGLVRGKLLEYGGVRLFLLSRHSAGHKVPPHKVNYRALALALKALGIKNCLSTAAVGSVRAEWGPGTLVACSDFLDFTYRNVTLFDRTVVHRDFSEPFAESSRTALLNAGSALRLDVQSKGVYLSLNGPRYETPQEIHTFRSFGGDLVGMTAASEAIVMREAEIDYGCLAIVTNLAAGMTEATLNHEEVVEEMTRSGEKAVQILLRASELLAATP